MFDDDAEKGVKSLGVRKALSRFAEAGLSLLFPEICQFCRACSAGVDEGFVCAACRKRFRFVEHPFCDVCGSPFEGEGLSAFRCGNCDHARYIFQAARSAVVVNEFSLEVIHHYKYYGMVWLDDVFTTGATTDACARVLKGMGAGEIWIFTVARTLMDRR